LQLFKGRTLLSIAIETALEASIFQHVIVSTEDDETIEIALAAGAEVPFVRPRELCEDDVRADAVMAHAARYLEEESTSTELCCLLPTTPGLVPQDLKDAGQAWMRLREEYRALFAISEYQNTAFRSFTISSHGELNPLFPEKLFMQTQDLAPTYNDAGQFYFASLNTWKSTRSITAEAPSKGIILPNSRAVDINTEADLELARLLLQQ
jgi:N-acylneuraminate cytidylyltransferase